MTEYVCSDRHASKGYLLAVSCTALGLTIGFFIMPGLLASLMIAGIFYNVVALVSTIIGEFLVVAVFYTCFTAICVIASEVIWPIMFAPAVAIVDAAIVVGGYIASGFNYIYNPVYSWLAT